MAEDLFYQVTVKALNAVYDLSQDLTSLTIDEKQAKPDQLTIHLSDPYKVFNRALQEGMNVEVDLGTADEHAVVFRGRIYRVESDFPGEGVPTLKLLVYDNSLRMGLRKRNRLWTDMTLEDIVLAIANDHQFGGNAKIDLRKNPPFKGNGIRQQDKTDLAFLLELAAQYGCEIFVNPEDGADKLYFIAQYKIMKSTPAVTLYHGRCGVANALLSFQASSDMKDIQLPRVFAGIDQKDGKPIEVTTAPTEESDKEEDSFADENLAEFRKRYSDKADKLKDLLSAAEEVQRTLREELGREEREIIDVFTTEQHLNMRAQNQFNLSRHGMRGSGTAVGNPHIHAQNNIRIDDVGGRFSTIWYLSEVRHILDGQGYRTEFQCQR